MKSKIEKNLYYLSILTIALLAIIVFRLVKVYDIFCLLLSIIIPVVCGYIFAWILDPVFKRLSNKLGKRIGITLLTVITILFYAILIWKLLPIIFNNIVNLSDVFTKLIDSFSNYPILDGLKELPKIDMNMIIGYCGSLISIVVEFAFVHIFGFYILYNYELVNNLLRSLIPKKYKKISLEYIRKLSSNMRLYIKGTLLDTLILFLISSILYILIGLKYPIMLAFFSAITNIIPFIGPYIGGVPAVLVGLSTGLNKGIITLGAIIFAQTIESNIINPMIMSKCIKVNPILIVISLTIMGKFFGLVGMALAVPTIIVVKLTIDFLKKYKKLTFGQS